LRAFILWAAVAVAALGARPVAAATYTTDKSYQFSGQTGFNSGRGIAVNSTDTRLYLTVLNQTTGGVRILDTTTGAQVGVITPPSPTRLRDIAIAPDGARLYFIRDTDTAWTLESMPATDGTHTPAEVEVVDASPATVPQSLAIAQSGGDLYIGVAGNTNLYIYKKPSGGEWALEKSVNLPPTSAVRDIAAADTGSGIVFYILTPGGQQTPSVQAYNLDGTTYAVSFDPLPAAFQGYYIDSITAAGNVDGEPSLFLAADNVNGDFESVLTVFRYTTSGDYADDGFGYVLSPAPPLSNLGALAQGDNIIVPGTVVGNHFYLGAINPEKFSGNPQFVRIGISGGSAGPGSISGTVSADGDNVAGAAVVVAGRNTPVSTTSAGGAYTLSPLNAGAYRVGASKFGFVAASQNVSLAAAEAKTGINLTLPDTVPTFTLGHVFAPPIIDGQIFPGEYNTPPMPLYRLGGAETPAALEATAWVTYDNDNLYVAVQAGEPSLALNNAVWANQNMLAQDDNVQIFVDPPHRHDSGGSVGNLFQFAASIPPVIGGQPNGQAQRYQRKINPDGSFAESISSLTWFARAGYTPTGWTLEARISLDALTPFAKPDENSVWGLLIGRNRPVAHNDNLPTLYSTSPAQVGGLNGPNTWMDVMFEPPITGVAGDVNLNGQVDTSDALYILRMAAGLSFGEPAPGDTYEGDPNQTIREGILARGNVWPAGAPDTRITLEDAVRVLRAALGHDDL
jgi:hypothetical protein